MDEFIASTKNPLSKYFLQPEESHPYLSSVARLDLDSVKGQWIDKEMRARENSFTEYSFMHAFVGTWNVNGRNAPENVDAWLKVEGEIQPDIYVLCFQELDLSAEAYIVLDGSREEEWMRAIANSLGSGYQKVVSKQLVGLLIIMYAAKGHAKDISEVTAHSAGVGIMGMLGNKGGVSIRIRYKDSYLCFIGSHLAHDTSQVERRNQDYQEICRRLAFPSISPYDITKSPAANAAIGAGNKMVSIFECDHTIWAGDLNYRIALPEDRVKHHLKTNDYAILLKHDQLLTQRTLLKAFSEFEEYPINFQPTYKYDIGTNVWDSSEKRRVPSYTDRILWRCRDTAKDNVEVSFYKSHMELTLSDHKPVSAFFKLKIKTLLHDKQAEVHQSIVRELDKYENECMPDATISSSNVVFEEVRYLEPKKSVITIKNTGQFPAQYRFKPKLQDERFCKPWIWPNPPIAMIMPGESTKIHITVMVDNESAPMLNTGRERLEDILILHLEHGKDCFITVSGTYVRTCFGNSLEWLSRLDRPIRLWNPEENEDNDDDETSMLSDPYSVIGAKSSIGSIKDTAVNSGPRDPANKDAMRQIKSSKSLDSLSGIDPLDRKSNIAGISSAQLDEKFTPPLVKKQKPARQLSLPKDLWRIVDFIYKYGFSVDNLFLLSGDQSTMSYIRECLDTGEEFCLRRLLDKTTQLDDYNMTSQNSSSASTYKQQRRPNKNEETFKNEQGSDDKSENRIDQTLASQSSPPTLLARGAGSTPDLKPQIARPVSILNGIPPKAATFGLGENRGIHSMAEVLLRFLESLREPVVPTRMYYQALEVAGHQQAAYGLLDLMPPVHVNVFVYITSFLRELILVGGSHSTGSGVTGHGGKDGHGATGTTPTVTTGNNPSNTNNRILQSGSSASTHHGVDSTSTSGGSRIRREDEDYRASKLAGVFSSVMLRPPPGAERLSEVEALKRKSFLMQFLQEPAEEEGFGLGTSFGGPLLTSSSATTGVVPSSASSIATLTRGTTTASVNEGNTIEKSSIEQ
ncbi:Endonuclease/exonuclease/phosphatase [Lobosporangium transversale]|uniref:Endonuclease/exonuclease/phosphatase n=1 Tax=Lobosporangium transversale TaxID=64571 RepID=A0A1Y2GWN2_9FUNG|nr:Endonuclease/exonuclease/phosphatase [Lobosporangium transversale]ORZ23834.1 Endonuclease/exonuclease/phosphatase [Lobosporangium transversale]|eukprot:XP_021883648.1 Endonuclease/exonuclease/phosphatase [Lobosporangium transversale]